MNFLIVLGLYAGIVAVMFYLLGRRFGLAGLSLAAGSLLADIWALPIAQYLASEGVMLEAPPISSIAGIIIILLVGFTVAIKSPKVSGMLARLVNSLAFSLLAVAITYEWFRPAVVLDEASRQYLQILEPHLLSIITGLLILALVDVIIKHAKSGKIKK